MSDIQVRIQGPDYYCPDCGRWLVHVKPDGKFDLAAQAGLTILTDPIAIVDASDPFVEASAYEARCLRCNPDE